MIPDRQVDEERLVLVARAGRPWGRAGELLVELETDWPEIRFRPGGTLVAGLRSGERRTLRVRRLTVRGGRTMLGFEGIDSIGDAEPLAGAELYARRADAVLEAGEVHVADLPGLAVERPDGRVVGHVVSVLEGVAADLLVVATTDGAERLVPLVPEITTGIDPAAGRVVIDPPAGLLDEDEPVGAGGAAE